MSSSPPAGAGPAGRRPPVAATLAAIIAATAAAVAVAGCGAGYAAGTFHGNNGPFPGSEVTLGCLDMAVAAVTDPKAVGAVAELNFGNRCNTRIKVDLGAIGATGRYVSGLTVPLRLYDPEGEVHAGMLDVGGTGREILEFQLDPASPLRLTRTGDDGATVDVPDPALVALCLDLSRVDPDEPSTQRVQVCIDLPEPVGVPGLDDPGVAAAHDGADDGDDLYATGQVLR